MKKKKRLLELLRKVRYFSDLSDETLSLLESRMELVVFKPGEVICTEGEAGDRMFVIESGEVAVLKRGEEDVPVEITVLQAGEIAGAMSLFGGGRRSATLRALGETEVWVLDHATFQELLDQDSSLAKGLLASLTQHLNRETSVVAKLLSHDVDRRFRIAFFDSKPYMEIAFRRCNHYDYAIDFFETRLTRETVSLAAGFKVVCVFVNDQLDAAVIEDLHAMGVEMIALRCAGYNNVDLAACERSGIAVTRVPEYSPYAVAEHAVALMLSLNRRLHQSHARIRENNFSLSGLVGFDMHEKTAGIIGAGKIGKCVLHILSGFGCKLMAYDKYPDQKVAEQLGVCFVELDDLLAASDIISLHAPLIPETYHMIDDAAIEKMKPGMMLINTSRGALIDTRALLDGLKRNKIGYAGLDVYEDERDYFFEDLSDQIMPDDLLARLTTFNNVMVTSHQAFLTREALRNIADTTLENIREFESGKRDSELTHRVGSAK